MFVPVGRGQQVVAAGEPLSTRNGSRSEIRLYKCKGWEHTHIFTLVGRGQQVVTTSLPPGGPRQPETVLEVKLGYTNARDENIPVPQRMGWVVDGAKGRWVDCQHPGALVIQK